MNPEGICTYLLAARHQRSDSLLLDPHAAASHAWFSGVAVWSESCLDRLMKWLACEAMGLSILNP
jgi:hypothetical protein